MRIEDEKAAEDNIDDAISYDIEVVDTVTLEEKRIMISSNIDLASVVLVFSSMSSNTPEKFTEECFIIALILFSKINKFRETAIESFCE